MTPGTLYVVATPIGHLGDLTIRAAEILRQVEVVAAEDTRRTRGLLSHLGAAPKLLSFHAHSPDSRTERLLDVLRAGHSVALVTDAGTPVVSDPGASLVAAVREAGLPVVPVPGPTAVGTALSVGGLQADRYLFLGFLPRKGAERRALLARAAAEPWPVVFYEAANRLQALLQDLGAVAGGDRRAVVARELTKVHEEIRPGTIAELAGHYREHPPRGEVTVILAGEASPSAPPADPEEVRALAERLLAAGVTKRDAVRQLTESTGLPRNEVYRVVMEIES